MGSPAVTSTSYHVCPQKTAKKPHVGGAVVSAGTVTVGGLPIAAGSATVTAYGKPIARMGEPLLMVEK